jgi:hypothetical protein
MPVPLIIALVVVAGVWAAGAVWSFEHQSKFATSLGFHFGFLLPLVADGLPVAMAAVGFAAAIDGRPATAARLGTALAVAASATSNGMYADRRTNHGHGGDLTTIVVAVAIPVLAAIAFEVLLGEMRKQVLQRRGQPAPTPIPPLRLARVLLSPRNEISEWRRHVLRVTDPTISPEARAEAAEVLSTVRARRQGRAVTPPPPTPAPEPEPVREADLAAAAGPVGPVETMEAPRWTAPLPDGLAAPTGPETGRPEPVRAAVPAAADRPAVGSASREILPMINQSEETPEAGSTVREALPEPAVEPVRRVRPAPAVPAFQAPPAPVPTPRRTDTSATFEQVAAAEALERAAIADGRGKRATYRAVQENLGVRYSTAKDALDQARARMAAEAATAHAYGSRTATVTL